jgi:RimJ/RimL family protein N-acetyltransferase
MQMTLSLSEFCARHGPALEQNEVRHNVMLATLGAADPSTQLATWSLRPPGACAIASPGRAIVLGEVDEAQCRALAEQTAAQPYLGVVGPDRTAQWFSHRASELGVTFLQPIPQRIHRLIDRPKYPGAPGHARVATSENADLVADWVAEFFREAAPHDPVPPREQLQQIAARGQHMVWMVDDQPVSMAAIVRRTRNTAAIAAVYTPPALRGRGYAGSVTAAVSERAFAEGKSAACLYTDLRNPFSNRCYATIGFTPVCDSMHFPREQRATR